VVNQLFAINVKLIYAQNNSQEQSFRPPRQIPATLFPAPDPAQFQAARPDPRHPPPSPFHPSKGQSSR